MGHKIKCTMVTYVVTKIGQPKAPTSYKCDEFLTLIDFVGNAGSRKDIQSIS